MSALSVLEYARSHGLATDHTAEDLFEHLSQIPLILSEDESKLPTPDSSLFTHELTEPKLQLSREAGTLLAKSIRHPQHVIDWAEFLPERRRAWKLKIDVPLLAGDHETDVRRFKRDASSHLDADQLLETCSFTSSGSYQDLDNQWNEIKSGDAVKNVEKALGDERCHATKEALVHLSDTLKVKLTDESKTEILNSFLPQTKRRRARSLTPILMPEEQPPEPYIPSSPDLEFTFRSDPEVDFDSLVFHIDREMQEKDRIQSNETVGISPTRVKALLQEARTVPEVTSGEALHVESLSPSYIDRRQARMGIKNLKFDIPIFLSSSSLQQMSDDRNMRSETSTIRSSPPKSEQTMRASTLSDTLGMAPPTQHPDSDDDNSMEAFDEQLKEELWSLAESARKEVDTLLEDDRIVPPQDCLRLAVPQLDRIVIRPPWDIQQEDFLASSLKEMCLASTSNAEMQNEKNLNWQAIPGHLMQLGLHDQIVDDGKLHKWLESSRGVTRSEQLIFKKQGLRLLDMDDDSDNEMEEDIDLLIDMHQPAMATIATKRDEQDLNLTLDLPVKKRCIPNTDAMQDILRSQDSLTNPESSFSTSNALETFLDLRGGKFKRTLVPKPSLANELVNDPIQSTQSQDNKIVDSCSVSGPLPSQTAIDSTAAMIQVPSTPNQDNSRCVGTKKAQPECMELEWGRSIVVDTAILEKHRSLIGSLEARGADRLNVVYRELSKVGHNACTHALPDMILSPRTALLITNLQALNQRSLPGQGVPGQGMLQTRVLKLAQEYDRLFVLAAITGPTCSLSQAQVDTMTVFTSFCASLFRSNHCTATPVWVSSKENQAIEEALNGRAWDLLCRYAFPEVEPGQSTQKAIDTVALINDETLWEQLLRKAGLNPMAAQVVIGSLRRLDQSGSNFDHGWGLRRLVQLNPGERVDMFESTLGARMVKRLSDVLDRSWG